MRMVGRSNGKAARELLPFTAISYRLGQMQEGGLRLQVEKPTFRIEVGKFVNATPTETIHIHPKVRVGISTEARWFSATE